LKRWRDKARDALLDELRLFLKEEVLEGVQKLTENYKQKALRMHCFIVEKKR